MDECASVRVGVFVSLFRYKRSLLLLVHSLEYHGAPGRQIAIETDSVCIGVGVVKNVGVCAGKSAESAVVRREYRLVASDVLVADRNEISLERLIGVEIKGEHVIVFCENNHFIALMYPPVYRLYAQEVVIL